MNRAIFVFVVFVAILAGFANGGTDSVADYGSINDSFSPVMEYNESGALGASIVLRKPPIDVIGGD